MARPAHIPPPAVESGQGVASRERLGDVLGSLRTRRAGCGTHVSRLAHISQLAVSGGRRITTRERHGDVLGSLRSRRAGCGTHKWHA